MDCARKEVRDVFLSQGIDETSKQDAFFGPVLSVKPTIDASVGKFHVTLQSTDWVMTSDLDAVEGKPLDVGDIVRIGHLSYNKSMDYHAQVLEKVEVTGLANGCVLHPRGLDPPGILYHPTITLRLPSNVTLSASSVLEDDDSVKVGLQLGNTVQSSSWSGKRLYAYRLSITDAWTMIESFYPYIFLDGVNKASDIKRLIESRHLLRRTPDGGVEEQPYPLYKVKTFSELRTSLGQHIKSMDWIKLIGYSVDDEVMSSQMQRRGLHIKQWVAMHIKGLIGTTISNEPAANGCFAVLHCADKIGGGVHQHDSRGLHTRDFHGASPLRELHIEFKTATGEPAKLRGIHLWFQICTTHG